MKIVKLALSDQSYQQAHEKASAQGLELGQYVTGLVEDALAAMRSGIPERKPLVLDSASEDKNGLPVTIIQLRELCRLVWRENQEFNGAVRMAAESFGVEESTIRDKCTRRIDVGSTGAFLELLAEPGNLIDYLCGKYPRIAHELKKQFAAILPDPEGCGPIPKPRTRPPARAIHEMDLVHAIVKVLRRHNGSADKPTVEREVFDGYKEIFNQEYYQETVGTDTPRWLKNIQFARNTACNKLRLIKTPEEAGRGVWELTEAGRNWAPS